MSGKLADKVCLSKAEAGKVRTMETKATTAVVIYGGSVITTAHWGKIGTACKSEQKATDALIDRKLVGVADAH